MVKEARQIRILAAGDQHTFSSDRELTIGRAEESDVRLSNPYVSRRHGKLRPTTSGWVYQDLRSRHGTRLNGVPVRQRLLVGPVTLLLGEPGRGEEIHVRPGHVSTIFVCYRRDDAAGQAGRLRDRLVDRFGDDQVFLDIEGIRIGEDYRDRVRRVIAECSVVLVVIGRTWLAASDGLGRRRLDDPADNVRFEIVTALNHAPAVRVIPVLVQGATMPRSDELPEEMQPMIRLNALVAAEERWHVELARLVGELENIIRTAAQDPAVTDGELSDDEGADAPAGGGWDG